MHVLSRRGFLGGSILEELELEVQRVNGDVEFAAVVLEHAGQERLREVEERQPEDQGLFALDPVADGIQSLDQVFELEAQRLHGGLGDVVGFPTRGHLVVHQLRREQVHRAVHDFESVDGPLQVVHSILDFAYQSVLAQHVLGHHGVERVLAHNRFEAHDVFHRKLCWERLEQVVADTFKHFVLTLASASPSARNSLQGRVHHDVSLELG
mmetsp:Transcript_44969/g.98255  ORF Transcript_44969/g.98255 Transcript_44969/m.98255 type:complete len:210 (-) Transcript_44969:2486-3115(-)